MGCVQSKDDSINLNELILHRRWEDVRETLENEVSSVSSKKGRLVIGKNDDDNTLWTILWKDGPLDVIVLVLKLWPNSLKERDEEGNDLLGRKIVQNEWDFIDTVVSTFPKDIVPIGHEHVYHAIFRNAPTNILERFLDRQPTSVSELPYMMFDFVDSNKLDYFTTVLKKFPEAATVVHPVDGLSILLWLFERESTIDMKWIKPILEANPKATAYKDFDGKHPLHLAYQHGVSHHIIEALLQSYPEAANVPDALGRTPAQLSKIHTQKSSFTPYDQSLILSQHGPSETNKIIRLVSERGHADKSSVVFVVCGGDILLRDLSMQQKDQHHFRRFYSEQLFARHQLFETLLGEFSKMVGVDNKSVIEKAATLQYLAVHHLSNQSSSLIDLDAFACQGHWYQQEILKLVMRIYDERRSSISHFQPSVNQDAQRCLEDLKKNVIPEPNDSCMKVFTSLIKWLTKGLDGDDEDNKEYDFQGPVRKPLTSLFNKIFIRRGQTNVHIVGDMVRGSLLLHDKRSLRTIIQRIETSLPNITTKKCRQPNKFARVQDFLTYVHEHLQRIPYTDVLPYRFKMNSSQKDKDEILWYNLNFFHRIPEYHRVGTSEMLVAYELQIGWADEINAHRQSHDAYERDRILSNQPLLKNYLSKTGDDHDDGGGGDDGVHHGIKKKVMTNCSDEDIRVIDRVLTGKIATDVLLMPSKKSNHEILLNDRNEQVINLYDSTTRKIPTTTTLQVPERQCINNEILRKCCEAVSSTTRRGDKRFPYGTSSTTVHQSSLPFPLFAQVLVGPIRLDETKRYFVESLVVNVSMKKRTTVSYFCIGLYAHFGPYLVESACVASEDNSSNNNKQKKKTTTNKTGNQNDDDDDDDDDETNAATRSTTKKEEEGGDRTDSNRMNDDDDVVVIVDRSGCNISSLEQVCPLPVGTTAIEVIAYGIAGGDLLYKGTNLSLKVFDSL